MTLKSNQFICSARYIHVFSLIVICLSVLIITRLQAIFAYLMNPVTFDLWPHYPNCNQFIDLARYNILVLSSMVIRLSIIVKIWSWAIFAYIMSPVTFDLVTPKYNQLNGSGVHQSVLEITRSREQEVRTYGWTDGRTTWNQNASGYFVVEAWIQQQNGNSWES